jgi:predicted dehydrogenase
MLRIGLAGAGFVAEIHAHALKPLAGRAAITAVASRSAERAQAFAGRHGIAGVVPSFEDLLARGDIDAVDLCVPNDRHAEMAIAAARAGKHVICEKPLTGYFGADGDEEPIGDRVPKRRMWQAARRRGQEILNAAASAGVTLCYAENFIYAPPVAKLRRFMERSGGAILEVRAEESHSGSHAAYARRWSTSGGGSLLRLGAHPIGAALHLKQYEGILKTGRPILPEWVTAETARVTHSPAFKGQPDRFVVDAWEDVEDWSVAVIGFDDGTRATVFATDVSLGGVKNTVQVYMSNAVLYANINPNASVMTYSPDRRVLDGEYIAEKVETSAGWQFVSPDEDWMRGYPQEMEDFVSAITESRAPLSGPRLAFDTLDVVYAGYVSAQEGRRIALAEDPAAAPPAER